MGQVWGLVRSTLELFHTNEEEEGEYSEVTEEVTEHVYLPAKAKAAKAGEVHHYPSAPPHHYFEENAPPDLSFPEDTGRKLVAPVTVRAAPQVTTLSSIQAGIQQARREGDLEAWQFPVRIHPPDQEGNIIATFESFPFKLLKELKQAINQYRPGSPFVMGLLKNVAVSSRMIPTNWDTLTGACPTAA
ncbi:endogenous retrovirus group K member 24 Gag polyprotein-like [Macaca thibetana thibetana]|uniref:endogenous retrovirus group K member 24 Gag polyprotein-like n=1 Tax=Macaca thibetana thibetana TaxID=257877 RepID=UPI0021BC88B1|nr:endogenous retrovirus group K member 24 Gag polyprotein-like [Macaca thibetana thibetana]